MLAVVDPVVGELRTNLLPAPKVGRLTLVDEALDLGWEGEERLECREVVIDERWVDAVIDESEEADLMAGIDDALSKCLAAIRILTPAREGHNGNLSEGDFCGER